MEYLEGVYYSIVDSNNFNLIRFFKYSLDLSSLKM